MKFNYERRLLLKAGLVAGVHLALPRLARPQSTLLALPKVALVLGNSKYKEAPLKNPANDAKAIGDALKSLDFAVTVKLDAGRAEMAAAADAYAKELAKKKCVGLFYYAGHGVQLAWRNYMLPVDAKVDSVADIQKQAVEVNSVLEGIKRAGNALNVIILDACRDNPFGNLKGADQKGLSQMDAPESTLLAYATSPGNVASDGDGANGLYTEFLLQELKVPEAKVEDVFKRVRLGVRRKTNGAQIPWESTSLEEDFYFLPPAHLKKLSEAERQSRFEEELDLWESVKEAKEPGPLEDYLRKYPSGEFSELAQLQLDAVLSRQGEKRIEIASQAGNPFSQGFARADTNFKVGDFYSYRVLDLATGAEKQRHGGRITAVTDDEVIIGQGAVILDRMGNTRKNNDGNRYTDSQNMPIEFYVGKKWTTQYLVYPRGAPPRRRRGGQRVAGGRSSEMEYRIVGREQVAVPAGSFDCFKVEGRGSTDTPAGKVDIRTVTWYAPEKVRRYIANEIIRQAPAGARSASRSERSELVAFKQT